MAVPSVMADLSTTANSNSPAGTESPSNADDFLRAIQAIVRTTNAKGADIASATTTDIGAATGEFVDVTGTTTITGLGTVAAGIVRTVRFTGALTLTHNDTSLILPGAANITTAANDRAEFRSLGSGNWLCVAYVRASGLPIVNPVFNSLTTVTLDPMVDYVPITDASDSNNNKKALIGAPMGYISGLLVTNNVSDANNDLDISAGHCRNAANTLDVVLSASITKRMDAAFAAGTGNGGLGNAVSKPTSGTLHVFVIYNTTTFAVDVYGDTSVSGANVPSGWAIGRRIASYRTDSGANFIAVVPVELGGGAVWVPYNVQRSGDIADTSVSSAARETYAITVPTGIKVLSKITAQILDSAAISGVKFFDLATADAAVSLDTGTMSLGGSISSTATITGVRYAGEFEVMTDTSGQIGARAISTGTDLYANTIGYTDFRR